MTQPTFTVESIALETEPAKLEAAFENVKDDFDLILAILRNENTPESVSWN